MSEQENIKADEDVEAHGKSKPVKLANDEGSDETDVEAHGKSKPVKLANDDDDFELHKKSAKL